MPVKVVAPGRARGSSGPAAAREGAAPLLDRGSVSVFAVVFAVAVIVLLALILDGGIAMNARQRAADIAGQAARAAVDDLSPAQLHEGRAVMAPGACAAAAGLVNRYARVASHGVDRVTSATMVSCVLTGPDSAKVSVTITTRPVVPGVFGAFRETATVSAADDCGITRGGACP